MWLVTTIKDSKAPQRYTNSGDTESKSSTEAGMGRRALLTLSEQKGSVIPEMSVTLT